MAESERDTVQCSDAAALLSITSVAR